jgi:uncharacterized protein (DUF779 family)
MTQEIDVSREASALILELLAQHKEICFHLSTRYGPNLMCLPKDELKIGERDVLVAQYCGVPVYMARHQADRWRSRKMAIVLAMGRAPGFSLEAPSGQHFELRGTALGGGA